MMYAQLPLKIELKDEARFSTYVCESEGLKNTLNALQSALGGIDKNTQGSSENSVLGTKACCFIGPMGVGKTHLLQAACRFQIENQANAAKQNSTQSFGAGVYLPLGDVTLPFVPMVLDGMEQVDLVCVDDIDLVIGQEDWELALANLLMKSKNMGHAVFFASNQPIHEWTIITKELASAMVNVLPIPLAPIKSDKALVDALQKHAEMLGFHLSVEVCNYLIKQYSKNLQELLAVLGLLAEASIVQKRRVTLPFAKQILMPKFD